jgi:hypothetical protein
LSGTEIVAAFSSAQATQIISPRQGFGLYFFPCCAIFRLKPGHLASKVKHLSNNIRLPVGSAAAHLSVLHLLSSFHYF